jgi:enoyl-[acyl-carrier-protein] reductase (NADH)
MTAKPYGFIALVKAALGSTLRFLAKSFSADCGMSVNYLDKDIIKKAMRPE